MTRKVLDIVGEGAYMQKAGDTWDISPQFFLDFLQNFRLRMRNQYWTQAIAWGTILDGGSTILDGGSTILDGSSTIFCRISQFTHFCRDLHYVAIYTLFPQFFLAKIAFSATSHVFCMYGPHLLRPFSNDEKNHIASKGNPQSSRSSLHNCLWKKFLAGQNLTDRCLSLDASSQVNVWRTQAPFLFWSCWVQRVAFLQRISVMSLQTFWYL